MIRVGVNLKCNSIFSNTLIILLITSHKLLTRKAVTFWKHPQEVFEMEVSNHDPRGQGGAAMEGVLLHIGIFQKLFSKVESLM